MKAYLVNKDQKSASVQEKAVPKLRDDYILVTTKAIALNPTDWKGIAGGQVPAGTTVGCDYAGIVEEVGSKVTRPFKKGDRIFGTAHGSNLDDPETGVFAEQVIVKGDVQMHVPDNLSFEQAATLPLGSVTVMQGLYQKALGLKLPTEPITDKQPILIYGGSSATGVLGIQYAKLSGYHVLTTCSPKNFDYVKSLGADEVFDYNAADVGKQINKATNDKLALAWDTISLPESAKICADALSQSGSGLKYGSILPVEFPRKEVTNTMTLMYTVFGEGFHKFGMEFPASKEDFEYTKMFTEMTGKLLAEGKLKTCKETVSKEGLNGIESGLKTLKEGKNSGEKLVYLL